MLSGIYIRIDSAVFSKRVRFYATLCCPRHWHMVGHVKDQVWALINRSTILLVISILNVLDALCGTRTACSKSSAGKWVCPWGLGLSGYTHLQCLTYVFCIFHVSEILIHEVLMSQMLIIVASLACPTDAPHLCLNVQQAGPICLMVTVHFDFGNDQATAALGLKCSQNYGKRLLTPQYDASVDRQHASVWMKKRCFACWYRARHNELTSSLCDVSICLCFTQVFCFVCCGNAGCFRTLVQVLFLHDNESKQVWLAILLGYDLMCFASFRTSRCFCYVIYFCILNLES